MIVILRHYTIFTVSYADVTLLLVDSGLNSMVSARIEDQLQHWYALYHKPAYLRIDPLVSVRKLKGRHNREIGALLASALAYGKVDIIIKNCEWLFSSMEWEPAEFTMSTTFREKKTFFKEFRHRFNDGLDVALLLQTVAAIVNKSGSLEACFLDGYRHEELTIRSALGKFTEKFKDAAGKISQSIPKSFDYLLPSPESGSACKRLNMFLRWVVRKDDAIDLGIWSKVRTSSLVIPVDTHVAKQARELNLTQRKSADWKMAEEITGQLRTIDPGDPVRFDFSICRAGMVKTKRVKQHSFGDQ